MNIREEFLSEFQDSRLLAETITLINNIKANGSKEILTYYKNKNIKRTNVFVSKHEIQLAMKYLTKSDIYSLNALKRSVNSIGKKEKNLINKTVLLSKNKYFESKLYTTPLETIGIYIPRNLPSSLIFYCELARIAGVKNIILALPPENDGKINKSLLAAASLFEIHKIIAVGGRNAFPALAFGIGNLIPDKLYGPCSMYVDYVKEVLNTFYKVPIDITAGPSELLIFCDDEKNIKQIEYDLRAQMEHGEDSRCFILSTNSILLKKISNSCIDIKKQIKYILASDYNEGTKLINEIAPEILEIFVNNPSKILKGLNNIANVYVNTCSPLGDYCAVGKGCADPTYGMAKGVGGITLASFYKTTCITRRTSTNGYKNAKWITHLPELEGFKYHKLAIENQL